MSRIEIDSGPSKLDERLETFKTDEGDIMLSPQQAKDVLYNTLLGLYLDLTDDSNLKVKVLARIAQAETQSEEFNFTEMLKKVAEDPMRHNREMEKKMRSSTRIQGSKPRQREI